MSLTVHKQHLMGQDYFFFFFFFVAYRQVNYRSVRKANRFVQIHKKDL